MTLRSTVFDSDDAFAALEAHWRALAQRAPDVTVFSSWEWQSVWWKHYGRGHQLRLLSVWDNDSLLALLPLYVARTVMMPGVCQRQLRLVGSGGDTSPDYLGALIDPEHQARVTPLLIESLLAIQQDWDTLRFTDLASGTFTTALEDTLHARVAATEARDAEHIQITRLASSWDEHLMGMHPERRKRMRYLRKRAAEKIGAKFTVREDAAELPEALDNLIRLHRKRWATKEGGGSFRTSTYIEFHREVITHCARNGWIRLYCIEAPGQSHQESRTLAVFYCYRYRNEVLYFQSGFDPDFERYSLGQVLMGYALESAAGEGAGVFDMLKGEHAYKSTWSNDERVTREITAARATVPGLLVLGRAKLGRFARSFLDRKAAAARTTPSTGQRREELAQPALHQPPITVGEGAQRHGQSEECSAEH